MPHSCVGACKKRKYAATWLCKPNKLPQLLAGVAPSLGPRSEFEPLEDNTSIVGWQVGNGTQGQAPTVLADFCLPVGSGRARSAVGGGSLRVLTVRVEPSGHKWRFL